MATVSVNPVEVLSPSQLEIYKLLLKGFSPAEISKKLESPLGIINAQITRIKSKGVSFTKEDGPTSPLNVDPKKVLETPIENPIKGGASSNDQVANTISGSTAVDAEELRKIADKVAGNASRDVQPMVLMGCAIQFTKLCGGRMSAHFVIEEVYAALKAFVGNEVPEADSSEPPLARTSEDKLRYLEEQNQNLKRELDDLKKKVG